LVIEVDGEVHSTEEQKRNRCPSSQGI
jgi:hypothetical protein